MTGVKAKLAQSFQNMNLGQDILLHIFEFLDLKSLCNSSLVCQQWYEVSIINSLWKSHCRVICKKQNRPCHLGRAENWKERCTQLYSGKLYSRTKPKEFQTPPFQQLKQQLKPSKGHFIELQVKTRTGIREFVQSKGHNYIIGNAFYQHTKTETISFKKQIVLKDKISGVIYEGESARLMVGLRKGTQDWNIHPNTLDQRATKDFIVFVQSTSVNRALMPRTKVLYRVSLKYVNLLSNDRQ